MFLFGREKQPFVTAIVVAAGKATRMEGIDKQLADLCGMPVILHSLLAFDRHPAIRQVVVVCREEDIPEYLDLTGAYGLKKLRSIVKGGESRQASVFAGVGAADPESEYLCIHDGARPLVEEETITACLSDAKEYGAATAAVPVKDTIKVSDGGGYIATTPDRSLLYSTQTPQIFAAPLYREAMAKAKADGVSYTDDCQLVESLGQKVRLSKGSYANLKITTPEDLLIAQALFLGELPY